jgi:hypothetical protein
MYAEWPVDTKFASLRHVGDLLETFATLFSVVSYKRRLDDLCHEDVIIMRIGKS